MIREPSSPESDRDLYDFQSSESIEHQDFYYRNKKIAVTLMENDHGRYLRIMQRTGEQRVFIIIPQAHFSGLLRFLNNVI